MKNSIFIFLFLLISSKQYCQTKEQIDNMTESELKEKIADEQSVKACDCIEKFVKVQTDANRINIKIKSCIEETARTFDLFKSLVGAYKSGRKNTKIYFSPSHYDSESYFTIERSLLKNCTFMQEFIGTNNYIYPNSVSNDKEALELFNKGQVFLQKQNYKEAIKSFKSALKKDSKFSFAWDNLGIVYYTTDKKDDALKAFKNSMKEAPNGLYPMIYIPRIYSDKKDYQQALKLYKEVVKIYPNNLDVNLSIANLYYLQLNDAYSSFGYYAKAYKLTNTSQIDISEKVYEIMKEIHNTSKDEKEVSEFKQILKENNIKIRE